MAKKVKGLPLVQKIPVFIYDEEKDDYKEHIVNVRKLPLGKSALLGEALESIPKVLANLQDNPQMQALLDGVDINELGIGGFLEVIADFLPTLITVATDLFIDIIVIGTDLNDKLAKEIGIDEAAELLLAIFEVNNVEAIWGNGKKLQQMFQPKGQ